METKPRPTNGRGGFEMERPMFEDWIKWVKGVSRRREVLVIARLTGMSRREAATCCMEVWEWADGETEDGQIDGARREDIDDLLGVPGFAHAMEHQDIKWLVVNDRGIAFPRYEKHNGKSAKKRAKDAEKHRRHRGLRKKSQGRKVATDSSHDSSPTEGDKKVVSSLSLSYSDSLSEILNKEDFRIALNSWLAYKAERRESYTPRGLAAMLSRAAKRAAKHGLAAVIDAMERAQSGNWAGWDHDGSFENSGTGRGGRPSRSLAGGPGQVYDPEAKDPNNGRM